MSMSIKPNSYMFLIIAFIIIVIFGVFYTLYLQTPKKDNIIDVPKINQTQTPEPTPTFTEKIVEPTGKKILVHLNRRGGFVRNGNLNVKLGDEVVWENIGKDVIVLVSDDGLFEKKLLDYGKYTSYIFKKEGIYNFYLEADKNLNGTVFVNSNN